MECQRFSYGIPTTGVGASGGWVAEVVMIMSCTYFPRISPDPTTGSEKRDAGLVRFVHLEAGSCNSDR
jgi:hypothetical protein